MSSVSALTWRFFHPWWTYSNNEKAVRGSDGKAVHYSAYSDELMDADAEAMWNIGKRAFDEMDVDSLEQFESLDQSFHDWISSFRKQLHKLQNQHFFSLISPDGKAQPADFLLTTSELAVVTIMEHSLSSQSIKAELGSYTDDFFRDLYLHCSLVELAEAFTLRSTMESGVIVAALRAAECLKRGLAGESGGESAHKLFAKLALEGAKKRHANDPKQREKQFVRERFLEWEADPKRYKSIAKFAQDMLDKLEHLESQRVIEEWVRGWRRQAANDEIGSLPAD
jgi:hypothetical protein